MPRKSTTKRTSSPNSKLMLGEPMTTDRSPGLLGLFNYSDNMADGALKELAKYLASVVDDRPTAEDYACSVRTIYKPAIEENLLEPEVIRYLFLELVSDQQRLGLISKRHKYLAEKMLRVPRPQRGRGRPKGALGRVASSKRYKLLEDYVKERTLDRSLTQEQFAKERLGITDSDLENDFDLDDLDNPAA